MNHMLFDHVWQSTLVLVGIGLLTLLFRNNGAGVRHALWTAASLKFLVPFAALNWLGIQLSGIFAQPLPAPIVLAVYGAAQPFSDGPVFRALPSPGTYILEGTAIWATGIILFMFLWTSRWLKLRATLRVARDTDIVAPMPVKFSASLLEPGLVGIFRPVLLLPEGIAEKLTSAELQAIISHEACHLRRRDNLLATLHMLVQAIFWFWPLVWWLGTRLIAERERACDEAVVASGNDPLVYADSILKVCKHYIQSPLACASGVSGSDLKQRMEKILMHTIIARLSLPKKALLAVSAAALLAVPLVMGLPNMPMALAQQAGTAQNEIRQDFVIRAVHEVDDATVRFGAPGTDAVPSYRPQGGEAPRLLLEREGHIAGNVLLDASVGTEQRSGQPTIMARFTPEAQKRFADMTTHYVGQRLALVVGGKILTTLTIMEPIKGGALQIAGNFNADEARMLADKMMGR